MAHIQMNSNAGFLQNELLEEKSNLVKDGEDLKVPTVPAHKPVLLHELVDYIAINPAGSYVDCTGGGGGHGAHLLEKLDKNGRLLILDRDVDAVARLNKRFSGDNRVTVDHANFADLRAAMNAAGFGNADGIYADFGVSNFQLSEGIRGFSFRKEGPLDMRMDQSDGEPVSVAVNNFTADNLSSIIWKFGEERFAKKIVFEIIKRRAIKSFETTLDLAEVIKNAVPKRFHKKGIHPATQTFQALRIFVNGELEAIEGLMGGVFKNIKQGGRFAAISFHSLEDRIVKENFNKFARTCVCPPELPICVCGTVPLCKILTRKPITPSEDETARNPLARSAKMRVAERV